MFSGSAVSSQDTCHAIEKWWSFKGSYLCPCEEATQAQESATSDSIENDRDLSSVLRQLQDKYITNILNYEMKYGQKQDSV